MRDAEARFDFVRGRDGALASSPVLVARRAAGFDVEDGGGRWRISREDFRSTTVDSGRQKTGTSRGFGDAGGACSGAVGDSRCGDCR